jgi:hypothetical protein
VKCWSKCRYTSEYTANSAAKAAHERGFPDVSAYWCRACGCFHIGHYRTQTLQTRANKRQRTDDYLGAD